MFPHTTDVDSPPRQCLHHFCFSFIQSSHIPCGNSELGLGSLVLLGLFFIFLVFVVVAVAILNKTHSRLFYPLEFYIHKLYKCLVVLSNCTGAKYDCPFHVYRLMSHNQYNIRDQPTPQEIEVHLRLLSSVYVPLGHSDRRILSCPPPSVCPP